jgi:hypothetical protein
MPGPAWRATVRRGLHRFTPALLALLAGAVGLAALVPHPEAGVTAPSADYVVIVGVAGLRWDDVNPTDTPTIWRMAERGAIGALSVRSARRITCPGDGWLTLGAGNFARFTPGTVVPQCPPLTVEVLPDARLGASLPNHGTVVADNRALPWGAQPGALAEGVRCTSAIGRGAAIAAARPYGRVDRFAETLGPDVQRRLADCALSIVELDEIAGDGDVRRDAARRADADLATVDAARPERSLLVLAGLSDLDATSRLHVAVAQGPGHTGGWLTSESTSRRGYVQVVDLAPTALAALDRPVPGKLFAGGTITSVTDGRPAALSDAVGSLSDADREASVQRRTAGTFFTVLTIAELLLFAATVPLLRRARRPAGPVVPAPVPRWVVRAVEVLLIAAALAVPAALVADLVPWWRSDSPGTVFAGATTGVLAAATLLVALGSSRSRALAPLGGVAALGALAVAIDVFTGARLQLNGVAGYSAVAGGRYAGLGVIGLGMLVTGVLLAAGTLAHRFERRWRPFVIGVVGAVGMVLVGSPYLGADASGAVALSAGVCVAAAMAVGGWLTIGRLVWAGAAALAVAAGFAVLDYFRPEEERSSVGRFLLHAQDGTAGFLVRRIGEADVVTASTSPLTMLVVGSTLFVGFVLLRHWGGLRRLLGLFPAVRGAFAGIVLATCLAGLVEGVGFNTLGVALATGLPLATLATLRVLDHADDRTPAPVAAAG